jgi:uncharacterized SAM-binding protein YcdF (DUF218 family)
MISERETFFALVSNDPLKKADAIVILEGDGLERIEEGVRLFKDGWAPLIVISGGLAKPPHSIPATQMLPHVLARNVPAYSVVLEEKSLNTREQAVEIMTLAAARGWKRIIITVSHYHQYRAYLTLLKAMQQRGMLLEMINAPARQLPWFTPGEDGTRADLLQDEFDRIERYGSKGHVATYAEAIAYLQWKHAQP